MTIKNISSQKKFSTLKQIRLTTLIKAPNGNLRSLTLEDVKHIFKTKYNISISVSYLSLIERSKRLKLKPEIEDAFIDLYQLHDLPREEIFEFYRDKKLILEIAD